jgi:hypothetical protein
MGSMDQGPRFKKRQMRVHGISLGEGSDKVWVKFGDRGLGKSEASKMDKGQGGCAGQFYVNLTPARVTLEVGTSIEKMPPITLACGALLLIKD